MARDLNKSYQSWQSRVQQENLPVSTVPLPELRLDVIVYSYRL